MTSVLGPDGGELQWVRINDFSPGIISQSNYALTDGSPVPGRVGANQAAAQADGTYGCMALPNGGLGPGPGQVATYTGPSGSVVTGPQNYVRGAFVGPIGSASTAVGDELVFMLEAITGATRTGRLCSVKTATPADDVILESKTSTGASGSSSFAMTGGYTMCSGWIPVTLTSALTPGGGPYTSLPVTALAAPVSGGDQIQIERAGVDASGYGGTSAIEVVTASGATASGATGIAIDSWTPTYSHGTGAYVTDLTQAALTGTATLSLTYTLGSTSPANEVFWWLYPNPTTPTTGDTPLDLSAQLPPATGGLMVCHQNRIIFVPVNQFGWTTVNAHIYVLPGGFNAFYYTDPPNAALMGLQDEVFVQEDPFGIGSLGSMNSGELFCILHTGGGYLINGDLNNPTITYLGGLTSAGPTVTLGDSTPAGFVYCSATQGVWVWNGGSVSQKLSPQLRDDFFTTAINTNFGPTCQAKVWGQFIVVSNNWIYDTVTGGWWRLDNDAVPFVWYGVGFDQSSLYGFPVSVTTQTNPIAYKYSRTSPATTFAFQSYPIPVTVNRSVTIREIDIRAQGIGTVVVTLLNAAGAEVATATMTVATDAQPLLFSAAANAVAQDVTFTITATGSGGNPAPIVYELSIGYEPTQFVNPT